MTDRPPWKKGDKLRRIKGGTNENIRVKDIVTFDGWNTMDENSSFPRNRLFNILGGHWGHDCENYELVESKPKIKIPSKFGQFLNKHGL